MFPVYSEKILKKHAGKIVWCPTSDLAAIVYHDRTIGLCRDGTSPIWEMPAPDATAVTALTWDPSGNEFVIGSGSGLVTRVDATCYKPKSSTCWRSPCQSGITLLAWVKFSKREKNEANMYGFDPSVFDFDHLLPPLSMEPPDEPAPLIPNLKQVKPPLPEPPSESKKEHTLLLIGDESGHVHLCMNADYHIGSFNTQTKGSKEVCVAAINTDPNATAFQVLLHQKPDEFILSTIQCDLLHSRRKELCNIATTQAHILFLSKYIKQCFSVLVKHHTTITNLAINNAKKIADCLLQRNGNAEPMPDVELLGLIATGHPCEAVYEYFTEILTEQQCKRWKSRASHGYSSLQAIVCEHLQPACERLLYHLNTLHGYALWTERYDSLLDPDAVHACTGGLKMLMQQLEAYLADITKVSLTFEEFMKWMEDMLVKFSEGGTEAERKNYDQWLAIDHIRNSFASDGLKHYFEDPTIEDNNYEQMNLMHLVHELSKTCHVLLELPASTLSKQVAIVDSQTIEFNVTNENSIGRQMDSWVAEEEENATHQYYALLQSSSLGDILLIVKRALEIGHPSSYAGIKWDKGKITDFEFLDEHEIALLYQSNDASGAYLGTIDYQNLEYTPFNDDPMRVTQLQEHAWNRIMELPRTVNAVFGANGRPRRRVVGVVGFNRKASSYFLDDQ